jgi:transcription elongation factor
VPLSLKELREWVPEIADLAKATRDMATNHTNSTQFYRDVVKASSWQGEAAQAAMTSMLLAAEAHEVKTGDLSAAGSAMDYAEQDAQKLSNTVTAILDDAAQSPAVEVDQSTNQVRPPHEL